MKDNKVSLMSSLTDLRKKIGMYAEWPSHLNSPERSLVAVLDSLLETVTLLAEPHFFVTIPDRGLVVTSRDA